MSEAKSRPPLRYSRDPAAIYAESFATVRREARLDRFPPGMAKLATRVIHACGMIEVADRLRDLWQRQSKGDKPLFCSLGLMLRYCGSSDHLAKASSIFVCAPFTMPARVLEAYEDEDDDVEVVEVEEEEVELEVGSGEDRVASVLML